MEDKPNPDQPHKFTPRPHGSRLACKWCGAAKEDPIHTMQKTIRKGRRGQALLEMALVTPILMLMILGVFAVSIWTYDRDLLGHAAREGAVAGAMNSGDSCGVAITTARQVYPNPLSITACAVQGQYIEVTVGHFLELQRIAPFWSAPVAVTQTARAALR